MRFRFKIVYRLKKKMLPRRNCWQFISSSSKKETERLWPRVAERTETGSEGVDFESLPLREDGRRKVTRFEIGRQGGTLEASTYEDQPVDQEEKAFS